MSELAQLLHIFAGGMLDLGRPRLAVCLELASRVLSCFS